MYEKMRFRTLMEFLIRIQEPLSVPTPTTAKLHFREFGIPWSPKPYSWLSDPTENQEDWYRVCIMTFFLTYSVVLMNFLNSQLISAMTIKDNEDYINTLEDILRFPKVRIYGEADSSLSKIFTVSRNMPGIEYPFESSSE